MFKKEYLDRYIFAGIVMILLVGLLVYQQSEKQKALGVWTNGFQQASTMSSTTIGMTKNGSNVASSTLILAANDSRRYAACYNTNINNLSSVPININFGSTATTSWLTAVALSPAGAASSSLSYFVINEDFPYTGAIYAYASATATVSCIEN